MATPNLVHYILRLLTLVLICGCLALFGQRHVPASQAVGGTLEQYAQNVLNPYASGALDTEMYINTQASYNIPTFDCSFQFADWSGITEGTYNHFVQDGFLQYNNNTSYCYAGNTPSNWNPYGFTAFGSVGIDCDCPGYTMCNYGYSPQYEGYAGTYIFGCFYPFTSLGLIANHLYGWAALLYENVAPLCFPYGCYSNYVVLAAVDPSNGQTWPLQYYADTGVTQVNNYYDAQEIFSLYTDLTGTSYYNVFTDMPGSYAYFSSFGWTGYSADTFEGNEHEFVQPSGMVGETLCQPQNPPVGLQRDLQGSDIIGGTGYICN